MASTKVIISYVEGQLILQAFNILRKSNGLSREAIVILSQAQIQPFNKAGRDLTGINILAEDSFLKTCLNLPFSLILMI
jgi:hypothetical protein